jgi:hypothetical protein
MAAQSARLAFRTTMLSLLIAGMGATGIAWVPVAMAAAFTLLAWLSVRRSVEAFAEPAKRSFVLTTVAAG